MPEDWNIMNERVCPACYAVVRLITDTDYPQYGYCASCETWVLHVPG
jgi:hypothetical protein